MTMVSKTALGIAAGICGTLFVGYCVYFDRQRRSDPNFKRSFGNFQPKYTYKIIQFIVPGPSDLDTLCRRANKAKSSKPQLKIPDLRDHEAVQSFFLQQVQLGEELLGQGDIEGGVEHLGNAVAVCGQPNQLLQVLQQTLPPQAFHLLLQRLPAVSQRIMEQPYGGMTEEDVE